MAQIAIDALHNAAAQLQIALTQYSDFCMMRWAQSQLICLTAFIIMGCVMNKNKEKAEGKPVYWLHSLVVTILTSFGGGTVAPMLIGRPPFILSNDLILPITLVTWYIVHYIWGVHDLLTTTPARAIWSSLAALFRVHSGCNMTALAATILTAGPYYPCPAVGPVVVGTVVGSLGIFFPLDKGLAPIAAGTPWGTQQAFLVATFYHFMVTDKQGVIGEGLRAVVGTYSEQSTRVLLITLALATSLAQVLFHAEANLLTPFHKLLYLVFQVHGPNPQGITQPVEKTVGWDYYTRLLLERVLETWRVLIVLTVISMHVLITTTPSSLAPTQQLLLNKTLGTCQLLTLDDCKPFTMVLREGKGTNFQLASFRGTTVSSEASASLWSKDLKVSTRPKQQDGSSVYLSITADGILRLLESSTQDKQEIALWSSTTKCKGSGSAVFKLNETSGIPSVVCGDGTSIAL